MSASFLQPHTGHRHDNDPTQSLDLTIRFSASIPDLHLSVVPNPNTTAATLKRLIRASLPSELKHRRIRLIYAGKALTDDVLLNSTLKRPLSHPPSRTPTPVAYDDTAGGIKNKGKGKEAVRDSTSLNKLYVHCSIGDVVLSAAELANEVVLANRESQPIEWQTSEEEQNRSDRQGSQESTAPAPRGFDRLLSAGFSASEVHSLRLQFMAIQAHTHTPDTMPSPDTLRDMEDRWLDNGNSATSDGLGSAGGNMPDEDSNAGALDDMLYGAAMGFFWPVGCMVWGFREEGIWSQRRRMAILVGLLLNVGVGLVRYTS